jgi:glycosyltransferase involved in cell wall biosynthesis
VLAGGGDLEGELRARASARRVASQVQFPGVVDHGLVARYCAAADVIAVPSIRDDEGNVDGLPNVVLEALASATPVVATTAGGIGSVVQDEVTGWLVAERDADALARAIAGVLDDPARGRAVGAAARDDMAARFGWARVAERFEAAYDAAVR